MTLEEAKLKVEYYRELWKNPPPGRDRGVIELQGRLMKMMYQWKLEKQKTLFDIENQPEGETSSS